MGENVMVGAFIRAFADSMMDVLTWACVSAMLWLVVSIVLNVVVHLRVTRRMAKERAGSPGLRIHQPVSKQPVTNNVATDA